MVVLGALTIVPTLVVLVGAFTSWTADGPVTFVGFRNARQLITDDSFRNAFGVTLRFVALTTGLELLIGTAGAVALQAIGRAKNFVRVVLALPLLISPVITGIVWKMGLDEQQGAFTRVVRGVFASVAPLSSPHDVVYAIVAIDVWQWTPFVLLLLSFALDTHRRRLRELVAVDGLSGATVNRRIWMPLVLPAFAIVMALRAVDALKVFDIVQTATAGGPGGASEVLSLYAYKEVIKFTNFGYAAAICVVILAMASVLWLIAARVTLVRR